MTSFEELLGEALKSLQHTQTLVELAVLGLCLLLAAGFSRVWGRRQGDLPREGLNKAAALGLSSLRQLRFPLFALGLLLVARFTVHRWLGHPQILPVAMTLLLAMVGIRMVVFALEHTFARGFLLSSSIRIAATLIWITVALHLLGVLPDVVAWLDDIGFHVGKQRLSVWLLFQGLVTVLLTVLLALWVSGLLEMRLMAAEGLDSSLKAVLIRFAKALLMVLAVLLSLPMVGIDLTMLSVFGGALGVGLGLGLQKIASNYVSGFIILLDRSIRIGNVIAVGNDRGEVTRITTRYTVLKGVTGVEALVPNEVLVGSVVVNETYTDRRVRGAVKVQVAYGTDLERAMALLVEAALASQRVLQDPPPKAFMLAFADSGIDLELGYWIGDPEKGQLDVKSAINLAIWKAFQEAGIGIPYPQREVRVMPA